MSQRIGIAMNPVIRNHRVFILFIIKRRRLAINLLNIAFSCFIAPLVKVLLVQITKLVKWFSEAEKIKLSCE